MSENIGQVLGGPNHTEMQIQDLRTRCERAEAECERLKMQQEWLLSHIRSSTEGLWQSAVQGLEEGWWKE